MKPRHVLYLTSKIHQESNRLLQRELTKRNILGLAPSHGEIFFSLYRYTRMSMRELAERINKDKSTVTALVDKLCKLGYLHKDKDPDDQRITNVSLTEKTLALEPDFGEISKMMYDRIYRGFSQEDKNTLVELMARVKKNLETP